MQKLFFIVLLAVTLPTFAQTTAKVRPVIPGNCEGKGEEYGSFLEKVNQQESEQEVLIDVRFLAGACQKRKITKLYLLENPYIFEANLDRKGTPWYKNSPPVDTEVLHIGEIDAIFRIIIPKDKAFEKFNKRNIYFSIAPARDQLSFPWSIHLEYFPEEKVTTSKLQAL